MSKKTLQLTIDYMYNKTDNYFCLQWIGRDGPEELPYFSDKKVIDCNLSYGFSNKLTHIPVMLSGNIKNRKDKLKIQVEILEEVPIYTNIHFLKSHLQKAIRLKDYSRAISTAKHLLDIDPIQFLRRFSIIIIEDSSLNQYYSTLIWLMVAVSSGKMSLQLHHIEWLLGLVYLVCDSPFKEDYAPIDKPVKYILENIDKLDKYHAANIQAILIRASFGGMAGDTNMLLNAAHIWLERFQEPEGKWREYFYNPMRTISASVLPLPKKDWYLSAIDYHCFPKLITWINEALEEPMEDSDLKSIIWNCSSKTNYRKDYNGKQNITLTNYQKSQWETVKKHFYSIAKYAIKNYS